jgi:hypothetical protein
MSTPGLKLDRRDVRKTIARMQAADAPGLPIILGWPSVTFGSLHREHRNTKWLIQEVGMNLDGAILSTRFAPFW